MGLKGKQEASGWPDGCESEIDKDAYITEFKNVENILLDKDNIAVNAGQRALNKIYLNSSWGKMAQRPNLPNTVVVRDYKQLHDMLTSPALECTAIFPVNDEVLYVSHIKVEDAVEASPLTNVVLAAYTTAHARLKLYTYLEKLGERAFYADTDSVIFLSKPGEYEPPTGNYLGDMTDELECYGPGSYISSLVCNGPKFYGYRVQKPDGSTIDVCKVKGIRSTYENSVLDYDLLEAFAKGEKTKITLEKKVITRDRYGNVYTRKETKTVQPVLKKRRAFGEHSSLPFGFKHM